jgi:hypothetical protein
MAAMRVVCPLAGPRRVWLVNLLRVTLMAAVIR